jgi:hypothetical protein
VIPQSGRVGGGEIVGGSWDLGGLRKRDKVAKRGGGHLSTNAGHVCSPFRQIVFERPLFYHAPQLARHLCNGVVLHSRNAIKCYHMH